ncbi:uncharacterized protein STEHIDRAFT_89058 [Stereum hirsutum FP-91666 SS1]|uniref:uncharacterized protein n=1 Tax=Stereum hirsutum (strain FP-91666) TaxID=721885 RepID=UPI00044102A2|nr:uncharacterized protein STEHIDRAFT_89058 [Stereum hirsutum FP-91666 SS1]EIM92216.1 hypothetical protein STEHIDRAFT_89058 [Stereum hirsutum FP-91666 SS1]
MDAAPQPPSSLRVAAVVSFYMGAALVMVFVNKAVLNSSPDLPLLFLFIQLIIAVILLHVSAFFSPRIEIPRLDLHSAKKLAPVVIVNIVGLVFNTLCLRDVEASFFQIARGLVLPLTIAVSTTVTHVQPSSRTVAAAALVTVGFFVGVAPQSGLPTSAVPSTLSLFYGVLSSLFIAIHAVLIKASLPYCNHSTIQLAYWTNLGSAALLAPFMLFNGEIMNVMQLASTPEWNGTVFMWGSLVTGVFGFLLCVAGLLSIKITSPVTHMFSSAARSVIQTLLGVVLFSDVLTFNRVASIFTILGGTMYYTWVKSVESAPIAPPPSPRDVDLEAMRTSERNDEEGRWTEEKKDEGQ